jgi:hypothetical protein
LQTTSDPVSLYLTKAKATINTIKTSFALKENEGEKAGVKVYWRDVFEKER